MSNGEDRKKALQEEGNLPAETEDKEPIVVDDYVIVEEPENETAEESSSTEQQEEKKVEEKPAKPQVEEKREPVAVLVVDGKKYPVYEMSDLINYAQMGVDYSRKLYALKSWENYIKAIVYNPNLRAILDKVVSGTSLEDAIRAVFPESNTPSQVPDKRSDEPEDEFSRIVKERVRAEIENLKSNISQELETVKQEISKSKFLAFLERLEALNPDYHNEIIDIIITALNDPAFPADVKKMLSTDMSFFERFYYALKDQIIARQQGSRVEPVKQEAPKPEPQKQEVKVKTVSKIPRLEGGKDSGDFERKILADADAIWNLPREKFLDLTKKITQKI